MHKILVLLLVYSPPFVFASGFNVRAVIAFILLVMSISTLNYAINRWNTAIVLSLAILFSILAGVSVSVKFGLYIFGICLCDIAAEAIAAPYKSSYIARKYSSAAIIIGASFMGIAIGLVLRGYFWDR